MNGSDIRFHQTPWVVLLLLAGAVALFEFTGLDLWLQDHFYNFASHRWLVDEKEPVGRAIFYHGPKALVWVIALTTLALAAGPARWRERFQLDRRGMWLGVLVITTVPALAGLGKKYTNVFCPSEIRRYGGDVAYAKLCAPFPDAERPARRGGCFPAGHASGGFALMGLLVVRASRRWRNGVIALGLGLGWWMGLYQMLKGAHYLSHTLTTMLVAWLVLLLWQRALSIEPAGG
ncbi:MAG: phosphatase PAP2 family protein [Lacunisphaera sp.]|nr:phosphatase PAP2 family protein [Lacunisphaera sp.]